MSDDEETILICMRVADFAVPTRGSRQEKCELCEKPVWAGQMATKYQCMQCAEETIPPDAEIKPITQDQIDAVIDYFKKHGN